MNNQKTFMLILTAIVLLIAGYGIYVEKSVRASATTILEDRLKPVPLISHRFDYYGTTIQDNFSSNVVNYEQLLANRSEIQKVKEETEEGWVAYKATYLTPDEAKLVEHAQKAMDEVDELVDLLLEKAVTDRPYVDSILKTGILNEKITPVLDDTNALLELQTAVGKEETVKMIALLTKFSNFMVGVLAMAFVLGGSLIYSQFKKEPQPVKRTTRKAPAKKPVARKPAVRKPTTRK
jgi:hypothetical protein